MDFASYNATVHFNAADLDAGTGIGDFAIGNSTVSAFLREREWVYQRELYYQ